MLSNFNEKVAKFPRWQFNENYTIVLDNVLRKSFSRQP